MNSVSGILIKPVSGLCDMNCSYCFYRDVTDHRTSGVYGKMTSETLENTISFACKNAKGGLSVAFQGGEPTLAGIDFYKEVLTLEKKYAKGLKIVNSIQTNGLALNNEWARFFADNSFLVGVSLDGILSVHDELRTDKKGKPTFSKICENLKMLKAENVEFNVLTVVTLKNAEKASRLYKFYKNNVIKFIQFIPCLDLFSGDSFLSAESYGKFLCDIFDLWYKDVLNGEQPYINFFEDTLSMILGVEPHSCERKGSCSVQYIIESDGSVYPCDFYTLDSFKIGNINFDTLEEINENAEKLNFIGKHGRPLDECQNCKYNSLCKGGCRRHCDKKDGKYSFRFCESYKKFFDYALPRLITLAEMIRNN